MRSIFLAVALFVGAGLLASVDGCGSSSDSAATPTCGNSNSCQQTDPVCSRSCGAGRSMLCQCGLGPLAGTLVCDTCMRNDGTGGAGTGGAAGRGAGGRTGRGTGGATAAGGRTGRGTGGAVATGGRAGQATGGAGGRMGRGTGGMTASGGVTGSGGFTPIDAGTPGCPGGVEAGGGACTATATPICQTACVNGMYNICTCVSGAFLCPTTQIACP